MWLGLFICGLVVAGLTAFPLEYETRLVIHWLNGQGSWAARDLPAMAAWLRRAHEGFATSYAKYPFLAYGTDWLGFGHLMIAVAFIGPLRDPIRNKWVIQFGMIACVLVLPLALIAGPLRGIPSFWTPIDCSFGVIGFILLVLAYRQVRALEREAKSQDQITVTVASS